MRRAWWKAGSKGLREGDLDILRRLLESRFGPLSPAVVQRLEASSEAELNVIADRALAAWTVEDHFS